MPVYLVRPDSHGSSEENSLQFLRSHDLLDITRVRVEHEDQGLVVEVGHFALKRGDVGNPIALGKFMARDDRPGCLSVKQGVLLG
jgi:hypothetical protein